MVTKLNNILSLTKKQKLFLYINKNLKFINNIYFPTSEIFHNKKEIDDFIAFKEDSLSFIYKNKNNIENILYNSDENLEIKKEMLNGIKDYFYLDLLIIENKEIINYIYEICLIREINEKNKRVIKNVYCQIIISKIILELINNYEQSLFFENSEINELNEIKQSNINIIEEKLEILKEPNPNFNMDYIKNTNIDEIYIDIIINLIKTNKFGDDDYIQEIIKELDYENIILTKVMITKLSDTLNNNKQIKINYEIKEYNDLFVLNKINFYYCLFKYILKNTFYKYQIEFLNEMTKNTRNLIKSNFQSFDEKNIDDIKEKFRVFIESMTDSQYYLDLLYNKINNICKNNNLSKNLITKNNPNEPICKKQEEKKELNEKLIKFGKKLLNSSNFLIKNNENGEVLLSILNDKQQYNMKNFDDIEIDKEKLKNNILKYIGFLSTIKDNIKKGFINKFNLIIKIETFNTSYSLNPNGTYNIDCTYIFYYPNGTSKTSFRDDNILVNGINGKNQGFYYLINEINDDCYDKITFNNSLDINDIMNKVDQIAENKEKADRKKQNPLSLIDIGKLSGVSELEVFKIKKISDEIIKSPNFLKQLSNGLFVSGGNTKTLFIFNENYKKIKEIDLPNYPIDICEISSNEEEYIKFAIFFRKKEIVLVSINKFDFMYKTEIYNSSSYIFFILSNNNYIYSNESGTFLSTNIFEKSIIGKVKISKYSYIYGFELYKNLILLISNNIVPGGKNNLIIYDILRKENVYELEGYSNNISKNSLLLMKKGDSNLILSACKNYTKYQKNGILLVNFYFDDNQNIFDFFSDTSSFEPHSFCQLQYIYKAEEEIKMFETNYFLAGGFDTIKGVGAIKLYKIIFEYKPYKTKIEYIDDIVFKHDNFLEFNGPIISLIQSRKTGEILASCNDGTIYLLSHPNLNYFLYYDEQEAQDTSYINKTLFYKKPEKKTDDKSNQIDNQFMFNCLLENIGKKI